MKRMLVLLFAVAVCWAATVDLVVTVTAGPAPVPSTVGQETLTSLAATVANPPQPNVETQVQGPVWLWSIEQVQTRATVNDAWATAATTTYTAVFDPENPTGSGVTLKATFGQLGLWRIAVRARVTYTVIGGEQPVIHTGDITRWVDTYQVVETPTVGAIDGLVKDAANAPQAGWVAELKQNGEVLATATSGANGHFGFTNLAPGTYTVALQTRTGYQAVTAQEAVVVAGATTSLTYVVQALPGSIDGLVKDAANAPQSGWVAELKQNGQTLTTATSGTDGHFTFSNLAAGAYTVALQARTGYDAVTAQAATVTAGATSSLTFIVQPTTPGNGSIHGTVKKTDGTALVGWVVTLGEGAGAIQTTTDANGYYQFTRVVAGSWQVTVTAQTGYTAPAARTVTVVADQAAVADFVVGLAPGYIVGRVVNTNDEPLSGWTVNLTSTSVTAASTTSDANGYFFFWLAAPGTHTVTLVSAEGYKTMDPVVLAMPDGGARWVDFRVPAGTGGGGGSPLACIWGCVADQHGTALTGWTVALKAGETTVATSTTDSTGFYSFEEVAAGSYTVAVTAAAGYDTPDAVAVTVADNDLREVDFVATTGQIYGAVVSEAGAALAGWTVTLSRTGQTDRTATTDANGCFQWASLTAGNYTVTLTSAEGYKTMDAVAVTLAAGASRYVGFRVPEGTGGGGGSEWGAVQGTVVDSANQPLSGWTVQLKSGDTVVSTTTTNADGGYLFAAVTAGTYGVNLVTTATGYVQPAAQSVTVAAGELKTINFSVPVGMIGGVVRNQAGEPLSGWVINLQVGGTTSQTATTGADGRYTFKPLAAGDYSVAPVAAEGFKTPQPVAVTLAAGEGRWVGFVAEPGTGTQGDLGSLIWGRVTGTNSVAVANCTITLSANGQQVATTTTDTNGVYNFEKVEAGVYTVAVTLPEGYTATETSKSVTVIDGDVAQADFALTGGTGTATYTVHGRVYLTTDNSPVVGWKLTLVNRGTTDIRHTVTDEYGLYRFPGLAAGRYLVICWAEPGYKVASFSSPAAASAASSRRVGSPGRPSAAPNGRSRPAGSTAQRQRQLATPPLGGEWPGHGVTWVYAYELFMEWCNTTEEAAIEECIDNDIDPYEVIPIRGGTDGPATGGGGAGDVDVPGPGGGDPDGPNIGITPPKPPPTDPGGGGGDGDDEEEVCILEQKTWLVHPPTPIRPDNWTDIRPVIKYAEHDGQPLVPVLNPWDYIPPHGFWGDGVDDAYMTVVFRNPGHYEVHFIEQWLDYGAGDVPGVTPPTVWDRCLGKFHVVRCCGKPGN